jgi:hypothetical protein
MWHTHTFQESDVFLRNRHKDITNVYIKWIFLLFFTLYFTLLSFRCVDPWGPNKLVDRGLQVLKHRIRTPACYEVTRNKCSSDPQDRAFSSEKNIEYDDSLLCKVHDGIANKFMQVYTESAVMCPSSVFMLILCLTCILSGSHQSMLKNGLKFLQSKHKPGPHFV